MLFSPEACTNVTFACRPAVISRLIANKLGIRKREIPALPGSYCTSYFPRTRPNPLHRDMQTEGNVSVNDYTWQKSSATGTKISERIHAARLVAEIKSWTIVWLRFIKIANTPESRRSPNPNPCGGGGTGQKRRKERERRQRNGRGYKGKFVEPTVYFFQWPVGLAGA